MAYKNAYKNAKMYKNKQRNNKLEKEDIYYRGLSSELTIYRFNRSFIKVKYISISINNSRYIF